MAFFRCISNRSNLLTRRRCHPSVGFIFHHDDHRKPPSLQGISYFSGFANSSLLGSRRCVDFPFSSTAASFLRHMSTSTGGPMTHVADVTVQAVAAQSPALNEAAVAAADSFGPSALLQQWIDAVHGFSGFNWWASIALTTLLIRLALLPVLITDLKDIALMRLHLEPIKRKMLSGQVDAYEGGKQMARLSKEYGVSPFTPMKGLFFQVPIFISFLFALTNMAEKVPSFRAGGASWFLDLSTPDPFILPALTGLTFWITVECNRHEGLMINPFAGTMKNMYRVLAVATVPLTMGFPEALFCYLITSNVFSIGYGLALEHPAVKRFLGMPEAPVTPPAPANGNSSFLSLLKQLLEASQHASRSSPPVEVPAKVSDQRKSANAVMSRRIQSLEKLVKGRKRIQKG